MKSKDLTGKVFGKLTVTNIDNSKSNKGKGQYFVCLCECGKIVSVRGTSLSNGHTKTCGSSLHQEKHGMRKTRIYNIWYGMKQRCRFEGNKDYKYYGGRGITYCKEWENFINFYNDMIEGYSENLTLDRKDVNGNYDKNNCRWITNLEQQKNKRNSKSR